MDIEIIHYVKLKKNLMVLLKILSLFFSLMEIRDSVKSNKNRCQKQSSVASPVLHMCTHNSFHRLAGDKLPGGKLRSNRNMLRKIQ